MQWRGGCAPWARTGLTLRGMRARACSSYGALKQAASRYSCKACTQGWATIGQRCGHRLDRLHAGCDSPWAEVVQGMSSAVRHQDGGRAMARRTYAGGAMSGAVGKGRCLDARQAGQGMCNITCRGQVSFEACALMYAIKRATAQWRGGCTLGAMPSSGQGGSHWGACLDTPGDEAVAAGASMRATRLAMQLAGPRVGPINATCGRVRARQMAVEGQTPGAMARVACEAISTGAQRSRQCITRATRLASRLARPRLGPLNVAREQACGDRLDRLHA